MATNVDNNEKNTRDARRKQRRGVHRQKRIKERAKKELRLRLVPIWLRLIIIVVLLALSLIAGLVVGYGVIGSGEVGDTLKQSTWTHIVDLIKKDE
jgi:hypothetical protein